MFFDPQAEHRRCGCWHELTIGGAFVKDAKTPQKPQSSGKEQEEEASLARLEAHLIAVLKRAQKVSSKARRS